MKVIIKSLKTGLPFDRKACLPGRFIPFLGHQRISPVMVLITKTIVASATTQPPVFPARNEA